MKPDRLVIPVRFKHEEPLKMNPNNDSNASTTKGEGSSSWASLGGAKSNNSNPKLVPFSSQFSSPVYPSLDAKYTLNLYGVEGTVNRLIISLIGHDGCSCCPLTSAVDHAFRSLCSLSSLAATAVGPGLTKYYL